MRSQRREVALVRESSGRELEAGMVASGWREGWGAGRRGELGAGVAARGRTGRRRRRKRGGWRHGEGNRGNRPGEGGEGRGVGRRRGRRGWRKESKVREEEARRREKKRKRREERERVQGPDCKRKDLLVRKRGGGRVSP